MKRVLLVLFHASENIFSVFFLAVRVMYIFYSKFGRKILEKKKKK